MRVIKISIVGMLIKFYKKKVMNTFLQTKLVTF